MGKAARASAQMRKERRERLRSKFPFAARTIVEDGAAARRYIEAAPFTRMLIELGISLVPDLGVENHEATVALVKDARGLVTLTDEEFEHALRLATPPECRETLQ